MKMLGVIAGLKKTTLDKILPAGAAAVRLAPSSLAINAKLDSDFDGIPDVLEYQNGNSSSFSHDSDGDGFSDGAENDQGTNPNDANDKPEIEALIVTGNAEAGVEISQKRKIIIPAGSPNRLIVVALQSDEYPSYTSGDLCEGECPFNDQLRWLITLSNGETITGQVDVNDLHEKWETESDTFLGRSPVYFQEVKVVESKPDQDVVVEVEVGATNIEDGALPSTVMVGLLPVDLDIVHPATGELEEGKEDGANADAPDGGYVSVKRMIDDGQGGEKDVTPITQLKIHKIDGAQADWKTRLKFNAGGHYKIYKDEARTQLVTSEATELPANQDTILYFQGEKKSESRGGEEITMQIGINGDWHDGDSVKCTIVQSEFQIQVKAFIPYGCSEAEEIVGPELLNPLNGKVVQGDLHSIPGVAANARKASQFINDYSDNTAQYFAKAPFRVMQTVVLTPYKELPDQADEQGERKTETAPSSDHYVKATGVDPTERHLEMGFKDLLAAGFDRAGKPPVTQREFRNLARGNKDASVTLEGAGKDGAMGSILGVPVVWATADIHWELDLKVLIDGVGASPIQPVLDYTGEHDSYPAYEIIVLQSDGTFTNAHRRAPVAGAKPGPSSLNNGNAVPIAGVKVITK